MTQKAKGVDYLHSLSHTKWNCRYHIVFAPKFRREAFYEERRLEIGKILSDLCKWKGSNLIEGEAIPIISTFWWRYHPRCLFLDSWVF